MNARRRTLVVVVIAVLGIATAALITWGTSSLVRQRIGLASEPLSAGSRLLPSSVRENAAHAPAAGSRARSGATGVPSRAGAPKAAPREPAERASPSPRSGGGSPVPSSPAVRAEPAPTGTARTSADGGDSSSKRDD